MALRARWESGKKFELDFWRQFWATEGGEWPDDYRQRLDMQTPLDSWILKYLDPSAPVISILDVGSGPMTNLGKI